jgi:hypothetical protein
MIFVSLNWDRFIIRKQGYFSPFEWAKNGEVYTAVGAGSQDLPGAMIRNREGGRVFWRLQRFAADHGLKQRLNTAYVECMNYF